VAVDAVRNEIALQDENLFQIRFYNRTANTPLTASMTEPKRILSGSNTEIEFNCGLYIDQATGEIYSVNNDTTDTTVIFAHGAEGNVAPTRKLHTPHGTYGIAVDETNKELFLTVEHDNAVVAYRKEASDTEQPLRLIQGDHTKLADPHGVAVDAGNGWIFVANHGSTHRVSPDLGPPVPPNWPLTRGYAVPGSGESWPPSITVYDRTAKGDARPLRVIQGPRTRLNWPAQLFFDADHGELFVANDGDNSILVFSATADGDVPPTRTIRGPKTGLLNPTGVWVDVTHDEVVASSMGNHSATVYPRTADGDVTPLRTIRAAPLGKQALAIGNPGAVAYDSKRDQLLVPN
jgi:DNA-binding beta-propeller fold protein YncE